MKREIIPGVFEVGVRDYNRKTFDEIMDLPNGTSYNSYIVQGFNKTALIDTVDPTFKEEFLNNIKEFNIDYLIINHAEQDHSGSIEDVLKIYPNIKIICNLKCQELLINLLDIPIDKFYIIEDNDTLDLGYKNLKFIFTPWVHWPETMCTYLIEEKILFSCDFFGSHIASEQLYIQNQKEILDYLKRYFVEIMMPFRGQIKSNIEKLSHYQMNIIAPSHGQLHNNPQFIINKYKKWISDECENKVLIYYVSMHNSTKLMSQYLNDKLQEKNIEVKLLNISKEDVSNLVLESMSAKCIIFATPAFLTSIHPKMANIIFLLNTLRPKTQLIGIIGSYGWGQIIEKQIKEMTKRFKCEYLDSVLIKGKPKNFNELDELSIQIESKIKNQ
ncbi:MAG: FprA family A-type flavoprotein [Nanoarchaeota archaeon]